MTKVAINGFGRIGRVFFRQAFSNPEMEIIAINDSAKPEKLIGLLVNDPVYGHFAPLIAYQNGKLTVADKTIVFFQEHDPEKLPWKDLAVDIVVEASGVFISQEKAGAHLRAGAKRVVITAPPNDEVTPVSTPNINEVALKDRLITSAGSCTTNAVAPVIAVLNPALGIERVLINSIHAYTPSQTADDWKNPGIIPGQTGATGALEKVIPETREGFSGLELRVPVATGSIADITFVARQATSAKAVNQILQTAAATPEWQGIITASDQIKNSNDIIGNPHGAIVDLKLTRVSGHLIKIMVWYDNEWGYGAMLLKQVMKVAQLL